jgi:N-acetylmuramoyl-L-alanine amidase
VRQLIYEQLKKKLRGIKQQPLLVLDAVYMPSVLIELGFYQIKRRRVFKPEEGQDQMALQIGNVVKLTKKKNI